MKEHIYEVSFQKNVVLQPLGMFEGLIFIYTFPYKTLAE